MVLILMILIIQSRLFAASVAAGTAETLDGQLDLDPRGSETHPSEGDLKGKGKGEENKRKKKKKKTVRKFSSFFPPLSTPTPTPIQKRKEKKKNGQSIEVVF